MKRSETQLYRKLLLALRAHLRGEINLLVDSALDVVLDDVSPIPQRVCRPCRPIWQVGTALTVERYPGGGDLLPARASRGASSVVKPAPAAEYGRHEGGTILVDSGSAL